MTYQSEEKLQTDSLKKIPIQLDHSEYWYINPRSTRKIGFKNTRKTWEGMQMEMKRFIASERVCSIWLDNIYGTLTYLAPRREQQTNKPNRYIFVCFSSFSKQHSLCSLQVRNLTWSANYFKLSKAIFNIVALLSNDRRLLFCFSFSIAWCCCCCLQVKLSISLFLFSQKSREKKI